MGDVADMIIDGILCEQCGVLIDGNISGYPRSCGYCENTENEEHTEI